MSEIAREIASQPACWDRAATLARGLADTLPAPGTRVAAVGCGTSLFVARAFAALREGSGQGETDAFPASEFPTERAYGALVAITRSGMTTEVLRVLSGAGAPTVVITADAGSPATSLAGQAVTLGFADERSVVQTRFATTAVALLRAHLGHELIGPITDARFALEAPLPVEPTAYEHFVFLGHGWSVGIAEEAALKLREAAQVHTEAYPAMEYRHGPISLAGERSFVWVLGSSDPAITQDVEATGAGVRVASLDPLAELVLAQRLAVEIALTRGRDPDHPRHLTRSVVLSSGEVVEDGGRERTYDGLTRGEP